MISKSMKRAPWPLLAFVVVGALIALATLPSVADAHGPVAPVASSYLARVNGTPAGLEAQVVDGDQRMWLRVAASRTVVVLDYRGAPYLRFSRSGVDVNQNSAMFYLNQTPVAETPPSGLTRTTPPSWQRVSSGHGYGWHEGRLHALASIALRPGASYVGRWSIPVEVEGRLAAISGGLWHAQRPPIVWFWPIVVLLASVLAARRLRRPSLDALIARLLAVAALVALGFAAAARGLYGRPTVSVPQLIPFAITVAFVLWGLRRMLLHRAGYFFFFAVSFVAIWQGGLLIPTLWTGFVLAAVPAFVARAAVVVCLGCGIGLLLLGFWLADQTPPEPSDGGDPIDEDDPAPRSASPA